MKKIILAASALALGTAASANEPATTGHGEDMTADPSVAIAQPAPLPSNPEVMSQRVANFNVEMRAVYPICTFEIRDNCVQLNDPGGSNVDLAAEGSLGVNGMVYAVGGPDID